MTLEWHLDLFSFFWGCFLLLAYQLNTYQSNSHTHAHTLTITNLFECCILLKSKNGLSMKPEGIWAKNLCLCFPADGTTLWGRRAVSMFQAETGWLGEGTVAVLAEVGKEEGGEKCGVVECAHEK